MHLVEAARAEELHARAAKLAPEMERYQVPAKQGRTITLVRNSWGKGRCHRW